MVFGVGNLDAEIPEKHQEQKKKRKEFHLSDQQDLLPELLRQ